MTVILFFLFMLVSAAETIPTAESDPLWSKLRQNAQRAETSGDFEAAEEYHLQAIQAAQEAGDPAARFVAAQDLGRIYWLNNNGPAAVTYMRIAATILDHYFPGDDRRRGAVMNNIAIVLRSTGSLEESVQHYLEALRVFQSINAHENIADTYDGLAEVEIDRGKYQLAEEYSKRSLAILEKLGLENMTTGRSLETLARIYVNLGRTKEAEELIPRAEAIFRRNLPSANGDLLPCLDTKAIILFEQQRFSEAERLWKSIIESARVARFPPILFGATYHLAELYAQTRQLEKAQALFEQLLEGQLKGKPNDLVGAIVRGQLAYVFMEQHQDERAETLFQSAIPVVAASPMNTSLPYALMCTRYGMLKARHKDWRSAAGFLERGVKIQSDVIPRSAALADSLEISAQVYRRLSRKNEVKDCRNRVKAIRAVLGKPGVSHTVDIGTLAAEKR